MALGVVEVVEVVEVRVQRFDVRLEVKVGGAGFYSCEIGDDNISLTRNIHLFLFL